MKQEHDDRSAKDWLRDGALLNEPRQQLLDAAAHGRIAIAKRTPKDQRLHEERVAARLAVGIPVSQED
jgi:hypothetical protein